MMMKTWMGRALCYAVLLGASAATAQTVGKPAPAFTATDTTGKPVALSDFKGKYLVLEWTSPQCPFAGKHYNTGNMPETQKQAMAKDAAWLTIETTGASNRDGKVPVALQSWLKSNNASPTAVIVDADGNLARMYAAKTTPHMFVVDPQGTLIYAGAIDSKPTANPADIRTATNYVSQALKEAKSGKPVSTPSTKPYGCAVHYPKVS